MLPSLGGLAQAVVWGTGLLRNYILPPTSEVKAGLLKTNLGCTEETTIYLDLTKHVVDRTDGGCQEH